nr:ROK family protein [Allorhizobium sonneratiae]
MAAPSHANPYVIGIDLGGTKLLGGLADARGQVLARRQEPTRHGTKVPVIRQIADLALALIAETGLQPKDVAHMVVGVPGTVSPQTGLASLSPNLALPTDRPLAELLSSHLPFPVSVENDVNLAAYGEAVAGAGQGEQSLVFVSYGTGVGMGTVIEGQLLRGALGRAGEIGFLPMGEAAHDRAPDSENGLYEDQVGTVGILAQHQGRASSVAELFAHAAAGDAACQGDIERLAKTASLGLAAIAVLLDPAVTVIGGGIGSQPVFLERLRHYLTPLLPFDCRLEPSAFGAEAGMVGAIYLALDACQQTNVLHQQGG